MLMKLGKIGIIRKNSLGLTDAEFEAGVRILVTGLDKAELSRIFYDEADCKALVNEEIWSTEVLCLDSNQPSHILTKRYQSTCTEAYNRGPYARKYKE